MHFSQRALRRTIFFALWCLASAAQNPITPGPVVLTVVDENSLAVSGAEVVLQEPGRAAAHFATDHNGRVSYIPEKPYSLRVEKSGFYASKADENDPAVRDVRVVLNHEQMMVQQVNVTASAPGIDAEQVSDKVTLALPEIINIPYPTSRDIRNLLRFYPGVVQDASGQIHNAGSETWSTLDTLDGFDIRSPVSGVLAMRVSADAVRSIEEESTRYPVEFGRSTGGVIAFYTGMGDNRFRFNATDFIPSWRQVSGLRFDKFVPRFTFSGPLARNRAWFFDGLEVEYDHVYIKELPAIANTNDVIRGSNLVRAQWNVTERDSITAGVLFNNYRSPYEGLSSLRPQESTTRRNTIAWLPYARHQHSFSNGALLDSGVGVVRFRDGYEPHGSSRFEVTPELFQGSYFENLASMSQRVEGNFALYLPPRQWKGRHDVKAGMDLDHIGFHTSVFRALVNYLREDGTLLRQSTFPASAPLTRHNVEAGVYVQDRWAPRTGVLLEPGLRTDWDEIIRRPLFSPRLALVYSPARTHQNTKIVAGIGVYYEHTQLEYLSRALAGVRFDTNYAADGVTPAGPAQQTTFAFRRDSLREARAINWSVGLEQKLPAGVTMKFNFIQKRVSNEFTYASQGGQFGKYVLTNARTDRDTLTTIEARRTFAHGYALFGAYTHSKAHTNAAIDYSPTISYLGPQQSGPLAWDTPHRILSWGWVPFLVPGFKKNWDFVYTYDWHTGFPFTAINAGYEVVGAANARRFPDYLDFSPGLEVRFHFRGRYLGLRGVMENATDRRNPLVVNNVVDSPQFGAFSKTFGRALTARLCLIQSR